MYHLNETTQKEFLKELLYSGKLRDDSTSFLYALAYAEKNGLSRSKDTPSEENFRTHIVPKLIHSLRAFTLQTNNLDTQTIIRHLRAISKGSVCKGTLRTNNQFSDELFLLSLFGISVQTLSPALVESLMADKPQTSRIYRGFIENIV